jgi:hypothetical protein
MKLILKSFTHLFVADRTIRLFGLLTPSNPLRLFFRKFALLLGCLYWGSGTMFDWIVRQLPQGTMA